MNTLTREDIIAALAISDLAPDAQDEIIGDVGHNVLTHVLLAILEKLPAVPCEDFKQLSLAHKGEEAESLARQHIPDFDVFVARERQKALDDFKRLLAA